MYTHTITFEKLRGRENYSVWKRHMKSYLVIKDLWSCTQNDLTETSTEKEKEKDLKTLSEIILLIEPCIFSYIDGIETAKGAWEALEKSLSESGLSRKVALLKQLTHTKLSDFENMEEYVSEMLTLSSRVKSCGLELHESITASLMLAGLPPEFDSFVMTIENTQKTLTVDYVKTTLLQEARLDHKSSDSAMFTKNKKFPCHTCKKIGHYSKNCPQKRKFKGKKSNGNALFASLYVNSCKNEWFIDSGATAHMTYDSSPLINKKEVLNKEVTVADNSKLKVNCAGEIDLILHNGTKKTKATLKDVVHVPNLCTNLISVSQMASKGNKIVFKNDVCQIFNNRGQLIGSASLINGLYRLNSEIKNETAMLADGNHEIWHRRLGHICDDNLTKVKNASKGIHFSNKNRNDKCEVCVKGKQTRASYKDVGKRADNILDLVHSDVCGPLEVPSLSGARYILTFVDDYSRKVFVVPMRTKSQVFNEFKRFKMMVENQQSRKIKVLRTDNGTEYCGNEFKKFLANNGIRHEKTAPYTPEQGGVAERINRSIMERIRCMLIDAGLGKEFWAEAASTAAYLLNRVPCRGSMQSPEERWTKQESDLTHLKVFGCKALVHIPKQKRKKLDQKSLECIMMGYSAESKAYRLYDPKTRKIVISKDVIFFENKVICPDLIKSKPSSSSTVLLFDETMDDTNSGREVENELSISPNNSTSTAEDPTVNTLVEVPAAPVSPVPATSTIELDSSGEEYEDPSNDESVFQPDESTAILNDVRRSIRIAGMPKANYKYPNYTFNVTEHIIHDPLTYEEAVSNSNADSWKEAMKAELESHKVNETWKLVNLPEGKRPIHNKWVFKTKFDTNGNMIKRKARLVVKGFSQVKGIDYEETFAPVVRYTSIRFLIAIAAKLKLNIRQMDAVTAFLNGELHEDIYMHQPKGFEDGTKRVCKLQKSLYGLKQSSRVWNQKLNEALLKFGLNRSTVDQCVYFLIKSSKILIVAIYVDDLLIFSNDSILENQLKVELCNRFAMKDLGEASSVLGVRITHNRKDGSIAIDQSHYIAEVLKRFGMDECNPVSTPIDPNQKISSKMSPTEPKQIEEMSKIPYMQAIGCLLFVAQITRPDISYAVNALSRYGSNPGKAHWIAVKRVFRYLKGTINKQLVYRRDPTELEGYCDADYASNVDTRQTTTGYVFLFQNAAISWASKLQKRITLSSTESEYIAMVAAAKESIWLKQLQAELFPMSSKAIDLHCDNKSAIDVATNNTYSDATKHIDVKTKFLHQMVTKGEIELKYVPTKEMIADALTKGLPRAKLDYLLPKFGLTN